MKYLILVLLISLQTVTTGAQTQTPAMLKAKPNNPTELIAKIKELKVYKAEEAKMNKLKQETKQNASVVIVLVTRDSVDKHGNAIGQAEIREIKDNNIYSMKGKNASPAAYTIYYNLYTNKILSIINTEQRSSAVAK